MTDKQRKSVMEFIENIKQLSAYDLDNYKEVIAENLFFSGTTEQTIQAILNDIKTIK